MTPQSAGAFYQLHEEAGRARVCLRTGLAVGHKPPIYPKPVGKHTEECREKCGKPGFLGESKHECLPSRTGALPSSFTKKSR